MSDIESALRDLVTDVIEEHDFTDAMSDAIERHLDSNFDINNYWSLGDYIDDIRDELGTTDVGELQEEVAKLRGLIPTRDHIHAAVRVELRRELDGYLQGLEERVQNLEAIQGATYVDIEQRVRNLEKLADSFSEAIRHVERVITLLTGGTPKPLV